MSDVYRKVFQLEKSHSEISRLIKQGSVEIDGTKIHDPKAKVSLRPGQILRLDRKRAVRIALARATQFPIRNDFAVANAVSSGVSRLEYGHDARALQIA